MKKVSRNIFLFIIIFVFFLGLAPHFLILDKVQQTITKQINKSLDSAVAINNIHWAWLPLPHLTLVNMNVTNPHYDLSLPEVEIYPTWRIILGEIRKPGKILLDKPRIRIKKTAFLSGQALELPMPEATIIIKNGELEVESSEKYKDVLLTDSLLFSSIRGKLKLRPQEVKVNIQASSPFSRKISLEGSVTIPEKNYLFMLDFQDITLHESVKAFFKGRLIPLESTARLAGTVKGQKLQHIEMDLHGTLPGFVLKPQDSGIPLTCGLADLKLIKSGPLLRLDINNLEVKDPQANLSGYIERKLTSAGSQELPHNSEPVWTLDLSGTDVDLTSVRQKILTLWGNNRVAKTVSNIVLAGKAVSAAYRFSGRTADFKNLDSMIIEAEALNAAIHVPGVKLDLTKASGPIRIKDSILTGQGLSAQLGKNYGSNAELFLDLGKLGDTFKLDIDIDADLADLPPILTRLLDHNGFQRELRKFSAVSGKATGTLHLGDSLKNIATRVNVKNMQLAARYEPIPKTVFINSGSLLLEPGKVDWLKVNGHIGQQEITSTNGNVSWKTADTLLHIEKMQAKLEGASLFAMLQETGMIPQKTKNALSSLNGTIEITRGSLQGNALKPDSWKYDLELTTTGLAFASPLLPEPASTGKMTAAINHNEADIQEAALQFLEQKLSLKGLLKHHLLENWHGSIEFNGPVQAKLASWISSRGWFPEKLRPQIPCTMENIKVGWQGELFTVSGIILQGLAGGRLPMAKINIESTPEHLLINELTFYAPGEQGRLELDFWRLSPQNLVLSWEGFVNAETIAALFQHSSFTEGTLSGAFKISSFTNQPEATRFEGLIKAENLLLKTSSSEAPIVITNLELTGIGKQLRIPALTLDIGSEKITGSGQIAVEKDTLELDISVASSFLSKKSLANLSLAMQENRNDILNWYSDQRPGLQLPKGWNFIGRIGFDFDSFALSRITTTPYDGTQTITHTFYDVHGDLQLAPENISRTEIFSSKLCGLDFRSFWFSDDNLGQTIQLNTNPNETFRLEKVLPCLGVQQDIIEGEFSLQANLLKEANAWHGGNIYIKSSQGRILRLKTLSRIFTIVNITDLFEKNVENAGRRGFPFSKMDIDTHIRANNLIIDRAIIRGEGLNLFARGEIHLDDYDADLTLLIAPFKTFDSIVSKVPIIGQQILGEYGSRMSIPVAIKGPIADPIITPMHPEAVGGAVFDLVKDTFMLPYNILNPLEEKDEK